MKIQICLLINNYYLFDYKFILEHDEQLSSPSPQTPKSPKPKKGTGADTKISWASHPTPTPNHSSNLYS